jgi:hypothetical protein
MDNAGGARRSKFSPNGNANDEEYEIKSGKREATPEGTRSAVDGDHEKPCCHRTDTNPVPPMFASAKDRLHRTT